MSRVRGGNNFIQIRFSSDEVYSHSDKLDFVIPLDEEALRVNEKLLGEVPFIMPNDFMIFAKEAGNEKAVTSAIIGYLWKIYGLDF